MTRRLVLALAAMIADLTRVVDATYRSVVSQFGIGAGNVGWRGL
jgi:hypothetical protein